MSQYIEFYVRTDDKFCQIGAYGRSTKVYKMFDAASFVPYEKVRAIGHQEINEVITATNHEIKVFETMILQQEELINFVQKTPDSLEEKMSAFHDCNQYIEELKEEIKECQFVLNFADFLEQVLYCAPTKDYLYCGIEAGEVTPDMVVE